MSKLTSKARGSMPKSDFAVPSKAPGSGSYPINDASHARNALARAAGKPAQGQVDAAVHKRYPEIGSDSAAKGKPHAERAPHAPRADGSSGLDKAMSAHADKTHPC